MNTACILIFFIIACGYSQAAVLNFNRVFNEQLNTQVKNFQQDKYGRMIIATQKKIFYFDGYELTDHPINLATKNYSQHQRIDKIQKIVVDDRENLWVATNNGLLFYNQHETWHLMSDSSVPSDPQTSITIPDNAIKDLVYANGTVWFANDYSISQIKPQETETLNIQSFHLLDWQKKERITTLLPLDNNTTLVGTDQALYEYSLTSSEFTQANVEQLDSSMHVLAMHLDVSGYLWVGTNKGVLHRKKNGTVFKAFLPDQINMLVPAITSGRSGVWIGSLGEGLFQIKPDGTAFQHTYDSNHLQSLADNTIRSLFIDQHATIWVGSFYGPVQHASINKHQFGFYDNSNNGAFCSPSSTFRSANLDTQGNVWLAETNHLIKFNPQKKQCSIYNTGSSDQPIFKDEILLSLHRDKHDRLWVGSSDGLFEFKKSTDTFTKVLHTLNIHFMIQSQQDQLLLGTNEGLFSFNTDTELTALIKANQGQAGDFKFSDYSISTSGEYFFITSHGIFILDGDQLKKHNRLSAELKNKNINTIHHDQQGLLWLGSANMGMLVWNESQQSLSPPPNGFNVDPEEAILEILADVDQNLWVTTDEALWKFNIKTAQSQRFGQLNGDYSNGYLMKAAHVLETELLFFGGRNGFNLFDPTRLNHQLKSPDVYFSGFSLNDQNLDQQIMNDTFEIKGSFNKPMALELNYNDYFIGFDLASSDYNQPINNHFAYQLVGFHDRWQELKAGDRSILFSSLPAGDYTLKVKTTNQFGVWQTPSLSMDLNIKGPIWLTWWALLSYLIITMVLLLSYLRYRELIRVQAEKSLKREVKYRTAMVQAQKQEIESLLSKKNLLFTNISHEFRTPLTLIMGPIRQMLKENQHLKDQQRLAMVDRNATQLLTLVDQLLNMAEINTQENTSFSAQQTQPVVSAICSAFEHSAKEKGIHFMLKNNHKACIQSTPQTLETILSNLISNAIKYTPIGGEISVNVILENERLEIQVNDTGSGLTTQQKKEVFERFKRLDQHKDIQGSGLGLAIVEDIVRINQGTISVDSKHGVGSSFKVSLPAISNMDNYLKPDSALDEKKALYPYQLPETITTKPSTAVLLEKNPVIGRKNSEKILIIEDNPDMRFHIRTTLSDHFSIMEAESGPSGINLAIRQVPDVIICDVMMPEMDGFQVCRILRSDARTSHIPLIVLTALGDESSRVKGWREHVDMYLVKPFNEEELILRLKNVLVIRKILTQNNRNYLHKNDINNSELNMKDQKFVLKFQKLLKTNYSNEYYDRITMANQMAVSERQLQRKLKALLDRNPSDLLREFRLNKAAEMLKDGLQITQVAHECGFSHPSQFSRSFKTRYGMPPKSYQQTYLKK